MRLVEIHGAGELGLDGVLHAHVERQAYGWTLGQRGPLHGLHADHLVDVALDAGDALVVDVDVTDDVAGKRSARVGAAQLAAEVEAREAEVVHGLRGARRQSAADPYEAARAIGQVLA